LDGNVAGFGIMALAANRQTLVVVHHDEILVTPAQAGHLKTNRPIFLGAHYPLLSVHPAGQWIAARSGESNVLHLWNLAEIAAAAPAQPLEPGQRSEAPKPAATVSSSHYFAFSPDGSWLGVCWDHAFRFYRTGSWDRPALVIPRQAASDLHAPLAFASDGRTVALAATRHAVQLVRLPARPDDRPFVFATLETPDRLPIEILVFSPDSRRLAAATNRQIVELWNLGGLRQSLASLQLHQDWRDFPPGSESSPPLP
jgi:WD40 repeat protein